MLTRLLKQSNLLARLRGAWRHDAEEVMKPIRKELRRLAREVEQLQAILQETSVRAARGDRNAAQLKGIAELNEQQRQELVLLPMLLDKEALATWIDRAVQSATMHSEPFHHIVVDQLLPPQVYDLLIRAVPPTDLF